MNCPFYGHFMFRNNSLIIDPPFLLLKQDGNQCALVTTAHSPCVLDVGNEMVEWSKCPRMKDARMEPPE